MWNIVLFEEDNIEYNHLKTELPSPEVTYWATGKTDVITSYSIHYTKLYDTKPLVIESVKEIPQLGRFAIRDMGMTRITSYNVCYTKLLRNYF